MNDEREKKSLFKGTADGLEKNVSDDHGGGDGRDADDDVPFGVYAVLYTYIYYIGI